MREIFKEAERVVVWLGLAGDDSDTAMDWLIEDSRKRADAASIGKDSVDFQTQYFVMYHDMILDPTYASTWIALQELLWRDYWQRMWVIQEIAQATEVVLYCGEKSIPWLAVVEALSMLEFVSESSKIGDKVPQSLRSIQSYNPVFRFNALRNTMSIPKTPYWFYVLLDTFRTSNSTDPRDQIFALLGFFENSGTAYKELIQVDYKNRTVRDVYTDVVDFCTRADRNTKDWPSVPQINSHKESKGIASTSFEQDNLSNLANGPLNILVLSQIRQQDDINHDFPTWLPDWTKYYGQITIDTISGSRFCASGTEYVRPTFSSDRRLLTVHGFEIAKVAHLAELKEAINTLENPPNRFAYVELVKEWLNLAEKNTPRSRLDMQRFWRTLVLDTQRKDKAPESGTKCPSRSWKSP
ncbi:hypothetical protein GJ744_005694 [Endocarpon pusillum]|uniref:Heterokaryon incompatibility domain-containing protein n=1 Tax=Endocarpon pusillum TaxID=364733 RepID=A0A8H7E553_9EURO|nr:hypothetical protein GJ744_005694 [Endocarpon pusillum]